MIVKRIIVKHMPALSHLSRSVPKHVEHAHTAEMNIKSHIVNLGVVDGNPSATKDNIAVLDHIAAYLPSVENNSLA